MGWRKWQQKGMKKLFSFATLREPFHLLAITLLSLLLPLSFLLLARLSTAHYFLTLTSTLQPFSPLISVFFYTNPTLLHVLVSIVSVATLIHSFTSRIVFLTEPPSPIFRPRLWTAWILLCAVQVCVGLGIEGSIAVGVEGSGFGNERSLLSRLIFFLGLHETMLRWSRMVVKPVVDDTVFGVVREENWVERVAMAAACGALWWWRLRDEIEPLVMVTEVKRDQLMGIGLADFVGWWLYYLTVTIGIVRIVKGLIWLGMVLLCRRVESNSRDSSGDEDKV